jgi:hypothetical protein
MHTVKLHRDSHFFVTRGAYEYTAFVDGDFTGEVILVKTEHIDESRGEELIDSDRQEFKVPMEALMELVGRKLLFDKQNQIEQMPSGTAYLKAVADV